MSIEQTLVTMAAPHLAGGLHPNIAPQNGARPYGVYTHIVSPTQNTLSDGVPIHHDIFQVDVWDATYQGALAAGDAFAAALQAAFDAGTITGACSAAGVAATTRKPACTVLPTSSRSGITDSRFLISDHHQPPAGGFFMGQCQ